MTDHDASEVTAYIRKVDLFRGVKTVPFDEALADGRIVTIADALLESYMDCVLSRQVNAGVCGRARLSVVYTPLNGTGNKPVREVLRRIGVPSYPSRSCPTGISRPHHIPIRKSARPSNVRWSWPRPSVLTCCSPPIPIATG